MKRKASREREKWMTENEIKRKKEKGFTASQATRHLAMKSSAVRTRPCKSSCLIKSAAHPTNALAFVPPLTYFPLHLHSVNILQHSDTTRPGPNFSWIDVTTHALSCT